MVQLQADLAKIEAAGVRLVAISYDPVDVLAKFTAERKITFPLLSDPDSKTIQAYGTLNKEAAGKAAGVPNPGTFILDSQGIVRAKIFLEGYRSRHSTDELLQAAKSVKD